MLDQLQRNGSPAPTCARRASLLWFVPRQALRLLTDEAAAGRYSFYKHHIQHRFCPRCGIHGYGEGTDASGKAVAAINLRCIDGLDLGNIRVHQFDGKALW